MVGNNTPRTQIALPAQGVPELRDTLTSLLEEFGNEEEDTGKERHLYREEFRLGFARTTFFPRRISDFFFR